jgi:ethanolamine utilization protein EutP (predicted NTPase)
MKRKKVIIPIAVVGIAATATAAFAALGGFLNVPSAIQGLVAGGGAASCQTTAVTFTVPDPSYVNGEYVISTIGYSGISSACVDLGTADLNLNIWDGTSTLASGDAINMTSTSGVITLSSAVDFDESVNATYIYLVKDN